MGQKVNPIGLRIGINENWRSRWFASKGYAELLKEDILIRKDLEKRLSRAAISRIEIERPSDQEVTVDIFTARPGVVIGKRGVEVEEIRAHLGKMTGRKVQVNIREVRRPELDARLVAQGVAEQLSARVSFRRAMKKAVTSTMRGGAEGIKIACSGRLGGTEMSRSEWYREGRVPLHTLRAKVDYGFVVAPTTFGGIGVKVWIYKGEAVDRSSEEFLNEGLGLSKRSLVSKSAAKASTTAENKAVKSSTVKEEKSEADLKKNQSKEKLEGKQDVDA